MNNLEFYKRRVSELEEECVKKQNEINQLEESYGRMKARNNTWVNYIFPRATEEARKMIDNHQYTEIRIVTCKEWTNQEIKHEKKESDFQICEHQNRTEKDKTELERAKNTINQIDEILEKLFGVRHDVGKPNEFEKILKEKVENYKTISDLIPTEPIKVSDMLINASKKRTNCMTGKEYDKYIFEKWQLRQIAEHLLVYCNHNGEMEE